MIKELNKDSLKELKESETTAVLVFYRHWHGPSEMYNSVLESYAHATRKIVIYKCDAEKNKNIADDFGIKSVPTTIILSDNKIIKRVSGVQSKTMLTDNINAAIKKISL